MDYASAAASFDALYPQPQPAELRFVRAHLARQLEDAPRVTGLTAGLEAALPLLKEETRELAEWASVQAGDVSAVPELLGRGEFESTLSAARLLAAAAERQRALEASVRALSLASDLEQQSRARRLRAELAEADGRKDVALNDWQWLTFEQDACSQPAAHGADVQWERLSGRKLTKKQRYARAESFTKSGQLEAALGELDALASAPGEAPRTSDVTRTRAWAHYKSRSGYAEAARLFAESARVDPRFRAQDLFHSARALSRAQRDLEAIAGYKALAREFPSSPYAEEATYLVGRLYEALGEWEKATQAHHQTLARYEARRERNGRFFEAARFGLAVSSLAVERGAVAQTQLERLLAASPDSKQVALWSQLLGVALLQQGRRDEAQRQFESVVGDHPLSWAALASSARLTQMGRPLPALIPPNPEQGVEPAPLELTWPPKVWLLKSLGLDVEAERALSKASRSFSEAHAPRGGEALCKAYSELSSARARYRHAQRIVRRGVLERAVNLATAWLWDCIYPRPYAPLVASVANEAGLDPSLIYAVMRQESAFDPGVTSGAGARGLLQLMPATATKLAAERLGGRQVNLYSAPDNLQLGGLYLASLTQRLRSVPLAVAAYNAGPAAVGRWLAAAPKLPLDVFVAAIPYAETRQYVQKVIGNWARYRYLEGGEGAVPALELALPAPSELDLPEY
jgi:soluble lytic murein transglycosylase